LFVEWPSVAGATGYDVYYSKSTSRPAFPDFENVTGLSQEIPGLDNGTTYYIWVKAKNSNTDSNDASPMASGEPGNIIPGLYQGARHIGNQNLNAALTYISSNAVTNDDYYIVLGADESVSNKDLQYSYRTVGITLLGYSQERTINLDADTAMFYINNGVTLTLGENIILKGRSTNNYSLVCLDGGNLIINNRAKITGNKADLGGGVYIAAGNLTMNGGTISGNTANRGGGVYISAGNFIMTGGIINGNTSSFFGGGVYIDNGTFQKQPSGASGSNSGVIYGSDTVGNDEDGIQYANTAGTSGDAVYKSWYPRPSVFRDTTAGQTDHISY
jgi:hypothetical protein